MCVEKGTKHMRDSTPLGDGFSFNHKRQDMLCTYHDDDGMPRRKSSRQVLNFDEVDDIDKVANANDHVYARDVHMGCEHDYRRQFMGYDEYAMRKKHCTILSHCASSTFAVCSSTNTSSYEHVIIAYEP